MYKTTSKVLCEINVNQVNNTLALPVLIIEVKFGLRVNKSIEINSINIKFVRINIGYTLEEHRRNEGISEKLQVTPTLHIINTFKNKWYTHLGIHNELQHISKINTTV